MDPPGLRTHPHCDNRCAVLRAVAAGGTGAAGQGASTRDPRARHQVELGIRVIVHVKSLHLVLYLGLDGLGRRLL